MRRRVGRLAGLALWAAGLGRVWGEPAPPAAGTPAVADPLSFPNAATYLYLEQVQMLPREIVALGLKPGMTVVDIGAGKKGRFTFPMADALKGTGRVFAADTSPNAIRSLNQRIATQSYKNVTAVRVRPDGVDAFYKRHSFDLIFTNIYESLAEPNAHFFEELRPSLKKETGRLCIIYSKTEPDFAELEFGDFKNALRALAAQGPRSPVLRRLSWETRDLMEAWKGEPLAPEARALILADLNAMLADRSLFKDLRDFRGDAAGSLWISSRDEELRPKDARLRAWLATLLDHEGVFDPATIAISPLAAQHLRAFNRLLLMGIFQTHLTNPAFYIFNKESVIRGLERSGYELVSDDDKLLNYFHFSKFKRTR